MYQEATAEGLPQAKPGWNGRQPSDFESGRPRTRVHAVRPLRSNRPLAFRHGARSHAETERDPYAPGGAL